VGATRGHRGKDGQQAQTSRQANTEQQANNEAAYYPNHQEKETHCGNNGHKEQEEETNIISPH
jgi:hypothetical protein